jgi:hypothetical protein
MQIIKYFIVFFFIISCKNKENEVERNKYEILNLLYKDYSKQQMEFYVFPIKKTIPTPGSDYENKEVGIYSKKITKEDSLKKINQYLKSKENRQVFAFDLNMKKYHNLNNRKIKQKVLAFEKLFKKFITSKEKDYLNIKKITQNNNDSLIVYNEDLLNNKIGVEFTKFNVLISFSNIVFNDEYSKAILIGTRSFSGTDSHSLIYYLRKQNGKWKKAFEEVP